MTKKKFLGALAAATLAATGLTLVTEAPTASAAGNCHVEPSGNPWKHVCLKGPHRYKTQCNMMRNDMVRKGYGVQSCHWGTYSSRPGWYFWYGSN
ncbi:hypothetical protein ACFTSF_15340 [Kribbella sp. NPDC056951]|uniref:hypothetical protein n=1 Tax=Kribbella sp. NPDC056951 TaxID=3345978 RepID=UPI00362E27AC